MKKIKVTSPEEKSYKNVNDILESVIILFEAELKKLSNYLDFYQLVIPGEYPQDILRQVEKLYAEAGWKLVYCVSSSARSDTKLRFRRYEF